MAQAARPTVTRGWNFAGHAWCHRKGLRNAGDEQKDGHPATVSSWVALGDWAPPAPSSWGHRSRLSALTAWSAAVKAFYLCLRSLEKGEVFASVSHIVDEARAASKDGDEDTGGDEATEQDPPSKSGLGSGLLEHYRAKYSQAHRIDEEKQHRLTLLLQAWATTYVPTPGTPAEPGHRDRGASLDERTLAQAFLLICYHFDDCEVPKGETRAKYAMGRLAEEPSKVISDLLAKGYSEKQEVASAAHRPDDLGCRPVTDELLKNEATDLAVAKYRIGRLVGVDIIARDADVIRDRHGEILESIMKTEEAPKLVLIKGPWQSGKSTLAYRLAVEAHQQGIQVFIAQSGKRHIALEANNRLTQQGKKVTLLLIDDLPNDTDAVTWLKDQDPATMPNLIVLATWSLRHASDVPNMMIPIEEFDLERQFSNTEIDRLSEKLGVGTQQTRSITHPLELSCFLSNEQPLKAVVQTMVAEADLGENDEKVLRCVAFSIKHGIAVPRSLLDSILGATAHSRVRDNTNLDEFLEWDDDAGPGIVRARWHERFMDSLSRTLGDETGTLLTLVESTDPTDESHRIFVASLAKSIQRNEARLLKDGIDLRMKELLTSFATTPLTLKEACIWLESLDALGTNDTRESLKDAFFYVVGGLQISSEHECELLHRLYRVRKDRWLTVEKIELFVRNNPDAERARSLLLTTAYDIWRDEAFDDDYSTTEQEFKAFVREAQQWVEEHGAERQLRVTLLGLMESEDEIQWAQDHLGLQSGEDVDATVASKYFKFIRQMGDETSQAEAIQVAISLVPQWHQKPGLARVCADAVRMISDDEDAQRVMAHALLEWVREHQRDTDALVGLFRLASCLEDRASIHEVVEVGTGLVGDPGLAIEPSIALADLMRNNGQAAEAHGIMAPLIKSAVENPHLTRHILRVSQHHLPDDQVRALYKAWQEANPRDVHSRLYFADWRRGKGDFDEADKIYDSLANYRHNNGRNLPGRLRIQIACNRGALYLARSQEGDLDSAHRTFLWALKKAEGWNLPPPVRAINGHARISAAKGDNEKAYNQFVAAIHLAQEQRDKALGMCLATFGDFIIDHAGHQYWKAVNAFRRALAEREDHWRNHVGMARALMLRAEAQKEQAGLAQRDLEWALRHLRRIPRLDPALQPPDAEANRVRDLTQKCERMLEDVS